MDKTYKEKTGCCPIAALQNICQDGIPKSASIPKTQGDQLKAHKALLLLTGQIENDRLANSFPPEIKLTKKKPTLKVKKLNFTSCTKKKGAASIETHNLQRQIDDYKQREKNLKAWELLVGMSKQYQ